MMDGAIVSDNHAILEGPGTKAMQIMGSRNHIERNALEGSGAVGILLAPYPPMMASHNEFTGNVTDQLKASRGTVVLVKGANRNRLVGTSGSVTDSGEGNITDGLTPLPPPTAGR